MKLCKKVLALILSVILMGSLASCQAAELSEPDGDSSLTQAALLTSAAGREKIAGFTDIPAGADYAQAVAWCYENDLMSGTSATTFAPEGTLTRAMLAVVLYRAKKEPAVTGNPAFTDTQAGTWYSNAVVWASQTGLIQGYGNGVFGTNDPVTVEQLEVILGRYRKDTPTWTGDSAKNVPATRAQVAVALYQNLRERTSSAKVLVAYFSATGRTRPIAEKVAEITGGDLFEIVPAEPYTAADLNYNSDCRAGQEQNDPAARPAISAEVNDMAQYDAVLIGYPIWYGQAPKIIHTFLESYDMSGKTIAAFCTSGGSAHEDSSIRGCAPDAAWLTGQRFTGTNDVKNWINGLNLPKMEEAGTMAAFDFENRSVKLNSGYDMPIVGFSAHTLSASTCKDSFAAFLKEGGRLIDTASYFGAEESIG